MRRLARAFVAAAAAATLAVTACGGEEAAPKPSGAPMASVRAPAGAPLETSAPRVEKVLFEPDQPIAGGRVRAIVRVPEAIVGGLRLHYAWTVGGRALPADVPEITLDSVRKGDEVSVTVTASDGTRESAAVRTTTTIGNRRPQLIAVTLDPPHGLHVGDVVKAVPEANDPDGDALKYEVEWRVNGTPVPEHGLTLQTGRFHRGDRVVASVRASDGQVTTDPVASGEVQLENSPPRIVSRPQTRFENGVFRYLVEANDPDGDRELRFSLLSAPDGMTIDRMGGEIQWQPKPTQAGRHTIDVAVEDSHGGKDVQRFELNVGAERRTSAWDVQSPAAPANEGRSD